MVQLDAGAIEALWESYDALQYHRKRLLFLCRADLLHAYARRAQRRHSDILSTFPHQTSLWHSDRRCHKAKKYMLDL